MGSVLSDRTSPSYVRGESLDPILIHLPSLGPTGFRRLLGPQSHNLRRWNGNETSFDETKYQFLLSLSTPKKETEDEAQMSLVTFVLHLRFPFLRYLRTTTDTRFRPLLHPEWGSERSERGSSEAREPGSHDWSHLSATT